MQIEPTALAGVLVLTPARHGDARGFFSESWNRKTLREAGVNLPEFVQDNHSLSAAAGTLRGLHFQAPPHAQGKLVRCVRGAIWDVAVDARRGSPTFGRHVAAEITAENWTQIWVPVGFLHGFCTLLPDTEVIYKVTAPYDRDAERGVVWDSPDLGIPWPVAPGEAVLSDKDRVLPRWSDAPVLFP